MERKLTKKALETLSNTSLFSGLPEQQLEKLAGIAALRSFNKGKIIFSEGEPADGFYVVVAGRVKIFKTSVEGKEQILHIFESGEPFGEVPVFSGQKFPAMSLALKKTDLLFFPRQDFVDHPDPGLVFRDRADAGR